MSRIASGEQIQVRPTNNIYTVLAAVTVIVQIIGLIVIFMRGMDVGGIL